MKNFKIQKYLVGILSILLLVALLIIAGIEVIKVRRIRPVYELAGVSKDCVDCHEKKDVAPKLVEEWKLGIHAELGIGCIECHEAKEGEWDAFKCPESDILVAKHPTPLDCKECHEEQVNEFANSKHAVAQIMAGPKGPDRGVFVPTLATKHGCEQCHNIGNYWPDGSVGECDACHSKHRFSMAQARRPETCGECHLGPDHPHIEIYHESKHGTLYTAFGDNWDWNYETADAVPFDAPTCATCHISSVPPGVKSTMNVSSRVSWESQSPFAFRTTDYWAGIGWEQKRERIKSVCFQCHGKSFVERYLLTADLSILLYNETYKALKSWLNKMKEEGIILTDILKYKDEVLTAFGKEGYDEAPEIDSYHHWHHEGRRFRQGAIMMGADYTQWYGIWDLQKNLVNVINYAADHGLKEAKEWMRSDDANKFMLYPLYDIPGISWGISTLFFRTSLPMTRIPDYWDKIYKNVQSAVNHGLLSKDQWELYQKIYNDKERELGLIYNLPKIHKEYLDALTRDLKDEVKRQVLDFKLPERSDWELKEKKK